MKSCLPCVPHTSGGLELALHHAVLPATGSPWITSPWDGLRLYTSFLSTLKMFGFGQPLSFSPWHSKVPAMSLFRWILNWASLWWAEQGVQSCNCTWRAAGIREGFICTMPSFICTVPSCRAAWVFCEMGVAAARVGEEQGWEGWPLLCPGWAGCASSAPGLVELCSTSEEAELPISPLLRGLLAGDALSGWGGAAPVPQLCMVASQEQNRTAAVLSGKNL